MTSSNQVSCAPGQEPIHNVNGIFKGQKSEKGVPGNPTRRKNQRPHRKNLLRRHQHFRRRRSILCTSPKVGPKDEPGHEGRRWLAPRPWHPSGIRRSLVRVRAPNIRPPSLWDCAPHLHRMCHPLHLDTQMQNPLLLQRHRKRPNLQLSNQISNQKVSGSGSLPPPRPNENFYEATPLAPSAPPVPTTINIHNNNISSQTYPQLMRPNPNCGHKSTARWPNEFQAMFEHACFKFYDDKDIASKVTENRRSKWRETIYSVDCASDPKKLWWVVRSLNEKRTYLPPNQPISFGAAACSDRKVIANNFIRQYTPAPRINKKTRVILRKIHKKFPLDHSYTLFLSAQVEDAIKSSSKSMPTGPDKHSLEHLKHLGMSAIKYLTALLNLSVSNTDIPAFWK
jgi:hypothetical protein